MNGMNWQEIHRFDQDITLWINGFHSEISDVVWTFFSNIPVWIPMYVLIIAFILQRLGWRKGGIVVLSAILTVTFCSLFSYCMKELTERLRPLLDTYMLENSLHVLETGGKYTFFSAHSANAFGLATSTYWGLRMDNRRKYNLYAIFMFTWATLVAVSRIFVGKHYLGDVMVGICVGIVAGMMFAWMARKVSIRIMNSRKKICRRM